MKKFYQKVNLKSKEKMIKFLENHFRYDTMNNWNRSTSYANKMKVYNVIPQKYQNKVFKLMETEEFYDDINILIHDFEIKHNYIWQAGFNGRSSGYLVLYKGGRKLSDHKSYCKECGQKNYTTVEETGNICGKCGKKTRINKTFYDTFSYPGKGIDEDVDFQEWEIEELQEKVKLIQEFDKLCDNIVSVVINMAENYEVKEEEYTVIKTRKVLKEK